MGISNVAFLGPAGSYTELALSKHLNAKGAVSCVSISEVFDKVASGEARWGFVPIENKLRGHITETLDALYENQKSVYIEQSFVLEISHCLGVLGDELKGKEWKTAIKEVYSHDQALRQCSNFLRDTLPNAELCPRASTGSAAQWVKKNKIAGAAAIAAKETLESLGFEIAAENISNRSGNKTRFALLAPGDAAEHCLKSEILGGQEYVTSIVVDPGRDRQGILFDLLNVISVKNGVNLLSIHSRPDSRGGFVFHLDLEGHAGSSKVENCLSELRSFCQESTGAVADVIICGSYIQERFHQLPFATIGIIGGNGVMGQWFTRIFTEMGFKVICSDKDCGPSIEELANNSDVILLSVPMSAVEDVSSSLKGQLRRGQLLVENCSVKSPSLPKLIEIAPDGVEVLGIHTMFAGDRESLKEENLLVTKTEKSGEAAQAFENLFYKYGAKISYTTIDEHDAISAFLQALIQCAMIGLAEVMRESFASPNAVIPFSTPNSRRIIETMKRVLQQSDELLIDMQTLNTQYPETRRKFLSALQDIMTALDKGDTGALLNSVEKSREFFKANI